MAMVYEKSDIFMCGVGDFLSGICGSGISSESHGVDSRDEIFPENDSADLKGVKDLVENATTDLMESGKVNFTPINTVTTRELRCVTDSNDSEEKKTLIDDAKRGMMIQSGDFNSSVYEGLDNAETLSDLQKAYNLGEVNIRAGNLEQAYDNFKFAFKARKHLYGPFDLELAFIHEQLGEVALRTEHYGLTWKHYDDAINALRRQPSNQNDEIANILVKKGYVLIKCDEKREALKCFAEALPSAKQDSRTELLVHLGYLYFEQKDYENAMKAFAEVLTDQSDSHDFASIAYTMGYMNESMDNDVEAMAHFSKALSIMKESTSSEFGGDNHKYRAAVVEHMGQLNFRQGKYRDALDNCSDAMRIAKTHRNMQSVFKAYKNLALVYARTNQLEKAIECYEEQLKIAKSNPEEEDETLATILHSLGNTYYKIGGNDKNKAIDYYKEELSILERNISVKDQSSIATVLIRLATLHRDIHAHTDALKYLLMAIDHSVSGTLNILNDGGSDCIMNGALLSDRLSRYEKEVLSRKKDSQEQNTEFNDVNKSEFSSPRYIAETINDMGNTFLMIESYTAAITCYESSLRIKAKTLCRENDEEVIRTKFNHGIALFKMGSLHDAMKKIKEVLKAPQGMTQSQLSTAFNYVGKILSKEKSFVEAIRNFEKALEITNEQNGKDDKECASIKFNIGVSFYKSGAYDKSIVCFEEVLHMQKQTFGVNNETVASSLSMMGNAHSKRKHFIKAIACYKQALAIRESSLGSNHRIVLGMLDNMGSVLFRMKKYAEAESIFNRITEAKRKELGADHPDVGKALIDLAKIHCARRQFIDAEKLYEDASRIFEKAKLHKSHKYIQEGNKLRAKLDKAQPKFIMPESFSERTFSPEKSSNMSVVSESSNISLISNESLQSLEWIT